MLFTLRISILFALLTVGCATMKDTCHKVCDSIDVVTQTSSPR